MWWNIKLHRYKHDFLILSEFMLISFQKSRHWITAIMNTNLSCFFLATDFYTFLLLVTHIYPQEKNPPASDTRSLSWPITALIVAMWHLCIQLKRLQNSSLTHLMHKYPVDSHTAVCVLECTVYLTCSWLSWLPRASCSSFSSCSRRATRFCNTHTDTHISDASRCVFSTSSCRWHSSWAEISSRCSL